MSVQFVKTAVIPHGVAPSDEGDALRIVELCGRTAYKSEDKVTGQSAVAFVRMLKTHGHLSVLEHSNVVLKIEGENATEMESSLVKSFGGRNAYHRVFSPLPRGGFAVAGNFRAWVETVSSLEKEDSVYAGFLRQSLGRFFPALFETVEEGPADSSFVVNLMREKEQLKLLKSDPRSDLPVFIFKFVCDRGITHEVVRHRVFSFTQESTRYVNYRNRGMALILPEEIESSFDEATGAVRADDQRAAMWIKRAETLFEWYQEDLKRGLRPEIARDILPNLLKSEIFVSGRWSGWKHFVNLRESPQAHPRIRLIAREVRECFESAGLSF